LYRSQPGASGKLGRFWALLTEGWNEAWVPSPNGSGGAPRQGWIDAADGNFCRLWFFTLAQGFNFREPRNEPSVGNAYLGASTLYTPLSRRLLLITTGISWPVCPFR
jgi:hypothetical protein